MFCASYLVSILWWNIFLWSEKTHQKSEFQWYIWRQNYCILKFYLIPCQAGILNNHIYLRNWFSPKNVPGNLIREFVVPIKLFHLLNNTILPRQQVQSPWRCSIVALSKPSPILRAFPFLRTPAAANFWSYLKASAWRVWIVVQASPRSPPCWRPTGSTCDWTQSRRSRSLKRHRRRSLWPAHHHGLTLKQSMYTNDYFWYTPLLEVFTWP